MWWSTRLFLINIIPSLYFRLILAQARHGGPWSFILGGGSDIILTAICVLIAASVQARTRTRVPSIAPTLLWWLYNALTAAYFSAMHVLPSPEQARYLLDPHFLLASLNASAILAMVFLLALCLLLARMNLKLVPVRPYVFVLLLLPFTGQLLWFGGGELGNPLVQQIAAFYSRDKELSDIVPRLTHDLSGVPMTAGPAERPNVLLVVLEGIPGGYLPQNVEFVNGSADFAMTKMSRWAERGLRVPNFLAHRNQTINGLYSMLCADYPRLTDGTLITQELLSDPSAASRDTLPNILARNGYSTTYLQAAGLRFMDKDRFMRLIGFEEIEGEEWFDHTPPTFFTYWGINDRDFFLQSLKKIEALNEKRRERGAQGEASPWFLTLLTVGTHHPYTLPDDYAGGEGLHPKLRSSAFLDDALDLFLSRLKEKRVLENTLVIVTSDESHGMDANILLAGNWGLCFALMPEAGGKDEKTQDPKINPELFGLADLPLSILDYVGLAASSDAIAGRSIFRDYGNAVKRPLPGSWGDRFFVISSDAVFLKDFGPGGFVKLPYSGSPFSLTNDAKREPLGQGSALLSWAARTVSEGPGRQASRSWRFLSDSSSFDAAEYVPSEEVLAVDSKIWLSGGQYIQFHKGENYTLELRVSAPETNARGMVLDWQVYKLNGAAPMISEKNFPLPQLAPGERLALTCSVEVLEDFMLDSARLAARAVGGGTPGDTAVVVDAFALLPASAGSNLPDGKKTLYKGSDAQIVLTHYEGPEQKERRGGGE